MEKCNMAIKERILYDPILRLKLQPAASTVEIRDYRYLNPNSPLGRYQLQHILSQCIFLEKL